MNVREIAQAAVGHNARCWPRFAEGSIWVRPDTCPMTFTVDLRFCDSSGLAALLRVRMILEEQGRSLVLANPPRHFLTLAQIAGVGNPFSIAD